MAEATLTISIGKKAGGIEAALAETHSPTNIAAASNITVNLDALASTCNLDGTLSTITNYRFWASANEADLADDSKGFAATVGTKTITVSNVQPNSKIYCKVRVYSSHLNNAKIAPSSDETTLEIDIGEDKPPAPPLGVYKSKPTVYSELKEGVPLAESFEAMAGVSTNKYLYFAAGGSEFIVEIELKYMKDQTATRTYKSVFNGNVPCELNGTVTCPRPCAGHQVPAGTDSEGHTIYKTEYRPGDDCACPHLQHSEHNLHYVGGYSDTWTQTVKFDYMKITNLKLWKIDKASLDGMYLIKADGTDGVTASIAQGNPTYFCNIAQSDTSTAGRLRYSLEPGKHDYVEWNEGSSDNKHSNSKTSGSVVEQTKFTERRNMTTDATVMSDCLILQTSSGDQSIMYFQKTSNTAKTTELLTVAAAKEEMWDNNPKSAAGQAYSEDSINIGSYNGKYRSTSAKYNSSGGAQVSTIYDGSLALGINRPSRPSSGLRLVKSNIDILDSAPNGMYSVGYANVFYKNEINYTASGFTPTESSYSVSPQYEFNNTEGHVEYNAPYSPDHGSINNIIIHNPVSTEFAGVISLPASRDQRTQATLGLAGGLNGQGDVCPRDPVLCF